MPFKEFIVGVDQLVIAAKNREKNKCIWKNYYHDEHYTREFCLILQIRVAYQFDSRQQINLPMPFSTHKNIDSHYQCFYIG